MEALNQSVAFKMPSRQQPEKDVIVAIHSQSEWAPDMAILMFILDHNQRTHLVIVGTLSAPGFPERSEELRNVRMSERTCMPLILCKVVSNTNLRVI